MAELAPESNVTSPDSTTRWIPTRNLPKLRHAVEVLAKRAEKLGVPPITLTEDGPSEKRELKVAIRDDNDALTGEFNTIIVDQTPVTIRGRAPVVPGGFEFLAKIEHLQSGKNIVSAVPGHTVPQKYRTASADCDHCQTKRDRRETFILSDPNDVTRQIGRTCLVDYTGNVNAEKLASLAAELGYFFGYVEGGAFDDVGESQGGGYGGSVPTYDKTVTFLASAIDVIAEHGFAKSDSKSPTYVRASDRLHPSPRSGQPVIWPTDAAIERAKKIIAWGALIPSDVKSEYLWNLKVWLAEDYLPYRSLPIMASAPVAYAKALGEEVNADPKLKPKRTSEYVGAIGDRTRLKLYLERSIELKSETFGDSYLHLLRTEQGDVAVWKTKTGLGIEGTDHDLVCTIDAHTDFKGIKQTVLKRCTPFAEKVKVAPTAEEIATKKAEKATLPWRKAIEGIDAVLGETAWSLGFGRYVEEPKTAADRKFAKRSDLARELIKSGSMKLVPGPYANASSHGSDDVLMPTEKGAAEITRAWLEIVDAGHVYLVGGSATSRLMEWWHQNRRDLAINDYHPPAGWKLTDAGRAELARLRDGDAPKPKGRRSKKELETQRRENPVKKPIKGPWYSGHMTVFDRFDPAHVGKGNDQLGPGFYFTTREQTARAYGWNILTASIDWKKTVDPYKKIPTDLLRRFLAAVPREQWDEEKYNWGTESPTAARAEVEKSLAPMWLIEVLDQLPGTIEWYGHRPSRILDVLVHSGYTGFVVRGGSTVREEQSKAAVSDELWAVVWDPEAITIEGRKGERPELDFAKEVRSILGDKTGDDAWATVAPNALLSWIPDHDASAEDAADAVLDQGVEPHHVH